VSLSRELLKKEIHRNSRMKGKKHSGSHPTPKKRCSFEKLSEGFTDLLYPSLKREDAAQQAFDIGT